MANGWRFESVCIWAFGLSYWPQAGLFSGLLSAGVRCDRPRGEFRRWATVPPTLPEALNNMHASGACARILAPKDEVARKLTITSW